MKIVIPGGSGQMGQVLARHFQAAQHEVVVLSRRPQNDPWKTVIWDGRSVDAWAAELDMADVIINLAGRSVNCRYNAENRAAIMNSRLDSTRAIGTALAAAPQRQRTWLQASTATIYAHRFDAANDEFTGVIGGQEPNLPDTWRFSIDVATSWEAAAEEFNIPGTRLVLLRMAMMMSPDREGVFDVLSGLVRRGLGGQNGNGKQYVSWIHDADFVRSLSWIIDRDHLSGPINLAAPNPLPNADFMRALRQAQGIMIGLPATAWMLEIGAYFMRTETELLLKSRRVVPGKLRQDGFEFRFPTWPEAAADLTRRHKEIVAHTN